MFMDKITELKLKALSLPKLPGCYLMKDKSGGIIYIGKAKALKSRVSSYFQGVDKHIPRVKSMVLSVFDFEYIVTNTELEALILECSLIKEHQPKYNILLKDGGHYPLIRISFNEAYPQLEVVTKAKQDGAEYFGPYGGRKFAFNTEKTIKETLKLPSCAQKFPRDIGKNRPCLNFHISKCIAPCSGKITPDEYRAVMTDAKELLEGNFEDVADKLRAEMEKASDELRFEAAAVFRDKLNAVNRLGQKQIIISAKGQNIDVFGVSSGAAKSCISVLRIKNGILLAKDIEIFELMDNKALLYEFIKQYYTNKEIAENIILSEEIPNLNLISMLLCTFANKKINVTVPKRGEKVKLCELAVKNASEELTRITTEEEKTNRTLSDVKELLGLEQVPFRIEAVDISNTKNDEIVGAIICFAGAKKARGEYRLFNIKGKVVQDDYYAITEVLRRRFEDFKALKKGFEKCPDLLLIDGGKAHVLTAKKVLNELDINIPVFGMVKNSSHKTSELINTNGDVIGISNTRLYPFFGTIQEEVHRFAITFHRKKRNKQIKMSALDDIEGLGKVRKSALFNKFKSINAIKNADVDELCEVVPKNIAQNINNFFKTSKMEGK